VISTILRGQPGLQTIDPCFTCRCSAPKRLGLASLTCSSCTIACSAPFLAAAKFCSPKRLRLAASNLGGDGPFPADDFGVHTGCRCAKTFSTPPPLGHGRLTGHSAFPVRFTLDLVFFCSSSTPIAFSQLQIVSDLAIMSPAICRQCWPAHTFRRMPAGICGRIRCQIDTFQPVLERISSNHD